jgi:hypothetical protein
MRIVPTLSVLVLVTLLLPAGAQTIDVVGSTASSATNTAKAKGNSYDVTTPVVLVQAEFWLNFSTISSLTSYVYSCPSEFGTYSLVSSTNATVSGTGPGWYSPGPLNVPMNVGTHYIIAVSWTGSMNYFYGVGDSQPVSFGSHTHGYASGSDPLPASFSSTVNDQAIYHQRLTTLPQGSTFPDYQINQLEAALTINGVQGTSMAPATPTINVGSPALLQLTSTNSGAPWDLMYGLAPLLPATQGGFVAADGQVVNMDFTDPSLGFLFSLFQGPGFLNLTIPFGVTSPAAVSMQMAVVDPVAAIGLRISQPTRLVVQ